MRNPAFERAKLSEDRWYLGVLVVLSRSSPLFPARMVGLSLLGTSIPLDRFTTFAFPSFLSFQWVWVYSGSIPSLLPFSPMGKQ